MSTPLFPKIDLAEIDYQVIDGDDSIIDAGEQVNLTAILYNDSNWGVALSPSITLNSLSNYFVINNSTQNTENINPGDVYLNIETPFEIQVSENTPSGIYEFELITISNDTEYAIYETQDTVSLSINNILFSDDFIPKEFKIFDAYPNPFNPSTNLSWTMNYPGNLLVEVYDLNGSRLNVLIDSYYSAGFHQYNWDATNFSNGIYFIRYSFQDIHTIQKLTLLK